MPIDEVATLNITCDQCGGHGDLDPTKRDGWLFVTHEIYGMPSQQHVFCCFAHASEKAATIPEVTLPSEEPAPVVSEEPAYDSPEPIADPVQP